MKRLLQIKLSQKEQRILSRWKRQRKNGELRERATMILAFWLGQSSPKVSKTVQRSVSTVLKWYHRFQNGRHKALCDLKRSGRPTTLDKQEQKQSIEWLKASPRDFGHDTDKWNPALWHQTCEQQFSIHFSYRSSRRLRRKFRVRWLRSKRWLRSCDSRYNQKRSQILAMRVIAEVDEDVELIYCDQFGPFGIRPHYGHRMQAAHTKKHLIPDSFEVKGEVRLFGGYCWKENVVQIWECKSESFTSEQTIRFLKWLLPGLAHRKRVYLVWDNAKWHVSTRVTDWLVRYNRRAKKQNMPDVGVLQLPVKAPWLNPIEAVWRAMRRNTLHAVNFQTKKQVIGAIMTYFESRNQRFRNNKRRKRTKLAVLSASTEE